MANDMIDDMVREGFKAMMSTPGMYCNTAVSAVRATRACLAAGLRAWEPTTADWIFAQQVTAHQRGYTSTEGGGHMLRVAAHALADRLEKPDANT